MSIFLKKVSSFILMLAVFGSVFSTSAYATSAAESQLSSLTITTITIPDISSEDAKMIGMTFVKDVVSLVSDSKWTNKTEIQDVITLYDVQNNITGYSLELSLDGVDNGYIIVSAYVDLDLIMEYSDEADPLYENLNSDDETILYTGTLEYYKKDEQNNIEDLSQNEVDEDDITNSFEIMGDNDVREKNLIILAEIEQENPLINRIDSNDIQSPKASHSEIITDPFLLGNFTAYEWNNPFEQYCGFLLMSRFNGLTGSASGGGHCAATALTNIMNMQRNAGLFSSSPSNSDTLFANNGKKWNSLSTYSFSVAQKWIKDCYSTYGRTALVNSLNLSGAGSDNGNIYGFVKTSIGNRHPLWIDIQSASNTAYNYNGGAHAVAGYAYNRLKNNNTGYFSSYIKVMDGWYTSGRYVSMGTLRGSIHGIS